MAILSTLESTNLDESIKNASRWFIVAQSQMQNLEFVNPNVTYTQPTTVFLLTTVA